LITAVIERIARPDARRGFVLDGFPRTIAQAEAFDDLLHTRGLELDHAIELQVEQILLTRVMARAREARERGEQVRVESDPQSFVVVIGAPTRNKKMSSG
jgi:adenylate kinase